MSNTTIDPAAVDVNFQKSLALTLQFEGTGYENVPGDAGGPTRDGITWIDGNAWRVKNNLPALSITASDACRLNYITPAVRSDIYYSMYWLPIRGPQMPFPLNEVVEDAAVNLGFGASVKELQAELGVTVDGQIGPNTIAAIAAYVSKHGQLQLISNLITRRDAYYDTIGVSHPTDMKFEAGWHNRDSELLANARKAIGQ